MRPWEVLWFQKKERITQLEALKALIEIPENAKYVDVLQKMIDSMERRKDATEEYLKENRKQNYEEVHRKILKWCVTDDFLTMNELYLRFRNAAETVYEKTMTPRRFRYELYSMAKKGEIDRIVKWVVPEGGNHTRKVSYFAKKGTIEQKSMLFSWDD